MKFTPATGFSQLTGSSLREMVGGSALDEDRIVLLVGWIDQRYTRLRRGGGEERHR